METASSEWRLPWEGGCRCGQVRLRVSQPPLLAMACHCTGCQSMSSSAFSLSMAIPAAGFHLVSGEPVVGGLRGPAKHMFCPHCMTWMFTRPEGNLADVFVNLRPTCLDRHGWFAPYIETYTEEKLAWATTPAVHSFPKFPEMAAYEGLIREFAAKGARPK